MTPAYAARASECRAVALPKGLRIADRFDLDGLGNTSAISVAGGFSGSSAVACWTSNGAASCLSVTLGDGSDDGNASEGGGGLLSVSQRSQLGDTSAEFSRLAVVRFTETRGLACFAGRESGLRCKVLSYSGEQVTAQGAFPLLFTGDSAPHWLAAAALTDRLALVCYTAAGAATCTALSLSSLSGDGGDIAIHADASLSTGEEAAQHVSIAPLLAAESQTALVCYSSGEESGKQKCAAVGAPDILAVPSTTLDASDSLLSGSRVTSLGLGASLLAVIMGALQ